jgi:hypothetical protein
MNGHAEATTRERMVLMSNMQSALHAGHLLSNGGGIHKGKKS